MEEDIPAPLAAAAPAAPAPLAAAAPAANGMNPTSRYYVPEMGLSKMNPTPRVYVPGVGWSKMNIQATPLGDIPQPPGGQMQRIVTVANQINFAALEGQWLPICELITEGLNRPQHLPLPVYDITDVGFDGEVSRKTNDRSGQRNYHLNLATVHNHPGTTNVMPYIYGQNNGNDFAHLTIHGGHSVGGNVLNAHIRYNNGTHINLLFNQTLREFYFDGMHDPIIEGTILGVLNQFVDRISQAGKNKYLKYKNKYLQLKLELDKHNNKHNNI